MLIVMAAMSAILMTAGRLIFQLSRAERAGREGTAIGRAEMRLARDFREDVRAAFAAEVLEKGKRLRLTTPAGVIEYAADDDGVRKTVMGNSARRDAYRLGAVEVNFGAESRAVTLSVRPRRVEPNAVRAAAGPLLVVAATGADRLGGEVPAKAELQPIEAPRPGREGTP
jgi:hypothetical protein